MHIIHDSADLYIIEPSIKATGSVVVSLLYQCQSVRASLFSRPHDQMLHTPEHNPLPKTPTQPSLISTSDEDVGLN